MKSGNDIVAGVFGYPTKWSFERDSGSGQAGRQANAARRSNAWTTSGSGTEHRILIVEDDPVNRDLIRESLADEGYTVLVSTNGRDGVDLARRQRPSLILMDLMLPYLSGTDAIAMLKEDPQTSWMHIIAMSAGVNLLRHAGDMKADSVLGKPFDLDVLLADAELHLRHVQQPTAD